MKVSEVEWNCWLTDEFGERFYTVEAVVRIDGVPLKLPWRFDGENGDEEAQLGIAIGAIQSMMPKCIGDYVLSLAGKTSKPPPVDSEATQHAWLCSGNTGASSLFLFRFMRGEMVAYSSCPWDRGDFGRCQALLDLIPAWEARLPEIAAAYPGTVWERLVDNWADLKRFYNERSPDDFRIAINFVLDGRLTRTELKARVFS